MSTRHSIYSKRVRTHYPNDNGWFHILSFGVIGVIRIYLPTMVVANCKKEKKEA